MSSSEEKPVKILLIEDNPGDARLLREALREKSPEGFAVTHVTRLAQGLRHLAIGQNEVVLLDLGLPDAHGLDSVRQIHGAAPDVPLIVLTGLDDEAIAVQSLQEGAQDYLTKGQIDASLLLRSIRYAVDRLRMQATFRSLALFDELTGLYNRRGFLSLGEHNLKLARRTRKGFALIFIDLDGFKQINDSYGHGEGDQALIEAAMILKDCFRQSDVVSRIGGDEFAVFMMGADGEASDVVRNRMLDKLRARNLDAGQRFDLSFSIGILNCEPDELRGIEELLAGADSLMYEEKKAKCDRLKVSPRTVIPHTG